jgi:hypothetical protein
MGYKIESRQGMHRVMARKKLVTKYVDRKL